MLRNCANPLELELLKENRELRLEIDKLKKEKEALEKGKKLINNSDSLCGM
ncbi:MAG: hypothetical protein WC135_03960 [Bacteroidales bacterium]